MRAAITARLTCPACGAHLIRDMHWQRNAHLAGCLVWLIPFTLWSADVREWHGLQIAGVIVVSVLLGTLVTYRAPLRVKYRFPRGEAFKFLALVSLAVFGGLALMALLAKLAG
jgi:hypothetical protein